MLSPGAAVKSGASKGGPRIGRLKDGIGHPTCRNGHRSDRQHAIDDRTVDEGVRDVLTRQRPPATLQPQVLSSEYTSALLANANTRCRGDRLS